MGVQRKCDRMDREAGKAGEASIRTRKQLQCRPSTTLLSASLHAPDPLWLLPGQPRGTSATAVAECRRMGSPHLNMAHAGASHHQEPRRFASGQVRTLFILYPSLIDHRADDNLHYLFSARSNLRPTKCINHQGQFLAKL